MKKIFSKKLNIGDEIRVIAPASSASTMKASKRKLADKRTQNNLGLKVVYGKNVLESDILNSSSFKSRLQDLHTAFKDKDVKGIACIRGGYNSNTLLPYIDWNLIKNNPKPIWGYSDITVLTNAIYAKTGLVTYSGPNYSTFGMDEEKDAVPYIFDNFKKCLLNEAEFEVPTSKFFGERNVKSQKNKGYQVLQNGIAEGIIIGGNLCSLNLLQGTEYMPSLKDVILFIEDDDFGGDQSLYEFERNLESLLQLPDSNIKGIVFGRFQKIPKIDIKKLQFILSTKKLSKDIPIVMDANFGHTTPMFTFPIGGTCRVEAKGKQVKIIILKH